jgi:ABC-type uncharacterized transport system ATPase subunit
MVGRKVILQVEKEDAHPGETVLTIDNLEVLDDRKQLVVKGLSSRFARARFWAWPASRATASASSSKP